MIYHPSVTEQELASLPEVTGSARYVGSQLGYSLHKSGDEVILLDNMSFEHLDNLMIEGTTFSRLLRRPRDSLSKLTARMSGVDTLYRFAGRSPYSIRRQRRHRQHPRSSPSFRFRRAIFASSSAIYEMTTSPDGNFEGNDTVTPNLVYSMTKDSAKKVCKAYSTNCGMDVTTVRFFNIYGPHHDFKRLSPPFASYLATTLAKGETPILFNS